MVETIFAALRAIIWGSLSRRAAVADEGDVELCRTAKELPGAAGKSGIIADWDLARSALKCSL
jgi:hypothetical protein